MSEQTQSLIPVAVVTGPHGVRGEVKVKSLGDSFALFEDRTTFHNKSGSKSFEITLRAVSGTKAIASFKGVKDRNVAETMKGTEICLDRKDFPELDDESFYQADLVGLSAYIADGAPYGEVVGVHDFGAGTILEIKKSDGKLEMISFTSENVPELSLEERRLTIIPPEMV